MSEPTDHDLLIRIDERLKILPELVARVTALETIHNRRVGGMAVVSLLVSMGGTWLWNKLFGPRQ